eukprot:c20636_g4_i1.p1 GENE.c20636_g4_i1~~c20636_g4_i1.p1  ORF type:complete len:623 (-),score=96.45 c20636_g4_i1:54-1922(-)
MATLPPFIARVDGDAILVVVAPLGARLVDFLTALKLEFGRPVNAFLPDGTTLVDLKNATHIQALRDSDDAATAIIVKDAIVKAATTEAGDGAAAPAAVPFGDGGPLVLDDLEVSNYQLMRNARMASLIPALAGTPSEVAARVMKECDVFRETYPNELRDLLTAMLTKYQTRGSFADSRLYARSEPGTEHAKARDFSKFLRGHAAGVFTVHHKQLSTRPSGGNPQLMHRYREVVVLLASGDEEAVMHPLMLSYLTELRPDAANCRRGVGAKLEVAIGTLVPGKDKAYSKNYIGYLDLNFSGDIQVAVELKAPGGPLTEQSLTQYKDQALMEAEGLAQRNAALTALPHVELPERVALLTQCSRLLSWAIRACKAVSAGRELTAVPALLARKKLAKGFRSGLLAVLAAHGQTKPQAAAFLAACQGAHETIFADDINSDVYTALMAARRPARVLLTDMFRMHVVLSTGWFVAEVFNPLRAGGQHDFSCVGYAASLHCMLAHDFGAAALKDAVVPESDGEGDGAGGAASDDVSDDGGPADGGEGGDGADENRSADKDGGPSSRGEGGGGHKRPAAICWEDADELREECARYKRTEIRAQQAKWLRQHGRRAGLTLQTLAVHNQHIVE